MTVPEQIEETCTRVNESGFYVGFCTNGNYYRDPTRAIAAIKSVVEPEYSVLHYAAEAVNPHDEATVIYKVDAGLVTAYPILAGKGFDRFFMPSYCIEKLNGIAFVSHKLKMLSFAQACIDVSVNQQPIRRIPLWLAGSTRWKRWLEWSCYARGEFKPMFVQNRLHASYKWMFMEQNSKGVIPVEIFFDIDDHFKNELLNEKIAVECEIDALKGSIKSANRIIASQQKKISEFEQMICDCNDGLKRFEVDLYASRVSTDLAS